MKKFLKALIAPIVFTALGVFFGYYWAKHEIAQMVLNNIKPCYDLNDIYLFIK